MADEPSDKPVVPETFSKEYVHELRQESKGYRLKSQESEAKAKAAEEAAAKAATDADAKIKEVHSAADQRVIRAELKAEAIKAGMVDLDGLKLADLTKVKLAEDGEVVGAAELMEAMKKAKPYLFGVASSSTGQEPPGKKPPTPKLATQMTKEEYAAAKRAAIHA